MGQGGVGLVYVIASVRDARVCVCVCTEETRSKLCSSSFGSALIPILIHTMNRPETGAGPEPTESCASEDPAIYVSFALGFRRSYRVLPKILDESSPWASAVPNPCLLRLDQKCCFNILFFKMGQFKRSVLNLLF